MSPPHIVQRALSPWPRYIPIYQINLSKRQSHSWRCWWWLQTVFVSPADCLSVAARFPTINITDRPQPAQSPTQEITASPTDNTMHAGALFVPPCEDGQRLNPFRQIITHSSEIVVSKENTMDRWWGSGEFLGGMIQFSLHVPRFIKQTGGGGGA